MKMGCGQESNTTGELLALLSFLYFSHIHQVSLKKVYGDSKIVIDWVNDIGRLHVQLLHSWKLKIKDFVL